MLDVGINDAARAVTRSKTQRLVLALAVSIAIVFASSLFAQSAQAAFTVTGFSTTPTSLQAGGHPNLNLHVTADAVAGDKNGDDLKSLLVDLPSGLLVNPQAVTTPCTSTQLSSDACPTASQVGTISVQYRIAGSTATSTGSVYSITPDSNSVMNFGFVVRPSSYQKFFFSSSKVSGLTTVRSGLDADYGLSILIPSIPNTVKSTFGTSLAMTISDVSINLSARSGSTQAGPYFVFNPTRCTAATTRATLTSTQNVVVTKTSAFTPTGCSSVPFNPKFAIAPNNPNAGQASGVTATVTMPTADASIQNAEVRDAVVTLPSGTKLNLTALNAVPALCADAQLSSDTCPAGSQIGSASVNVPMLPSAMTGSIYLTGRSSGFTFGYIVRGVRGTIAILRGSSAPVNYGGAAIQTTFSTLPQVPWSSATLNFSTALTINSNTGCGSQVAWGDLTGYTDSESIIGNFYSIQNCPQPPDTTISSGPTQWSRTATPIFAFTSTPAGASFECSIDGAAFTACTTPFTTPTLSEGSHVFSVRGLNSGVPDPTPASSTFTVDTVKPTLNLSSPTEGAVVNGTAVTADFVADSAVQVMCSMDGAGLTPCASPITYAGLAAGAHTLVVLAQDAAGNYSLFQPRHFSIAANPVVTLTAPSEGSTLKYDDLVPVFSATNPSGTALKYTCVLFAVFPDLDFEYQQDSGPCSSGNQFPANYLDAGATYRIEVTATDANGLAGTAAATFVSGNPRPYAPSTVGGPVGNVAITDRTPSFDLEGGTNPYHPNVTYECAVALVGDTPNFAPCGTSPESTFTPDSDLANGSYLLHMRSRDGADVSRESTVDFKVADWSATYSVTTSTQQAAAHPALDVDIKPATGQLRTIDMLLPKGLIGSLNSFPKCPLEQVPTAYDCPPDTQIGTVTTDIKIVGQSIHALGQVYLTEPQLPGDAAGLTIFVQSPLPDDFGNVVIPLDLALVNNSTQLEVFSNSIPITTKHFEQTKTIDANFYVRDFALHLNGPAGSPFPLLTNPSSCSPGNWDVNLGDTEDNHAAAPTPYQATGCDAVPFAPTFTQTYSNPTAGEATGVDAVITMPDGNSSLDSIHVAEPPLVAPNYPAFGQPLDQCRPLSATGTFNVGTCPPQSMVGSVTVTSPLLTDPLYGQVYLINASPLPELGVAIDDPVTGISIRLVGYIAIEKIDPACNPQKGNCPTHVVVDFGGIPDLPVSSIDFNLTSPPRVGLGGVTLPGGIVILSPKGNASCLPSVSTSASIKPQSSATPSLINVSQAINGC